MKTAAHHAFEQFYIDAGSRAPAFADGQYEKEIWRDQFTWFMRGMQHQAMTDDSKATAGEPRRYHDDEIPGAEGTVPLPEALTASEKKLRRLLCARVGGAQAYMDDGEARDATAAPHIDFMNDSSDEIERKLMERGLAALSASAPPQPVQPEDGK